MCSQNKRRKFGRDQEERESEKKPDTEEDPLKDATTLYVGNLYGHQFCVARTRVDEAQDPSTLPKSRSTNYSQSQTLLLLPGRPLTMTQVWRG